MNGKDENNFEYDEDDFDFEDLDDNKSDELDSDKSDEYSFGEEDDEADEEYEYSDESDLSDDTQGHYKSANSPKAIFEKITAQIPALIEKVKGMGFGLILGIAVIAFGLYQLSGLMSSGKPKAQPIRSQPVQIQSDKKAPVSAVHNMSSTSSQQQQLQTQQPTTRQQAPQQTEQQLPSLFNETSKPAAQSLPQTMDMAQTTIQSNTPVVQPTTQPMMSSTNQQPAAAEVPSHAIQAQINALNSRMSNLEQLNNDTMSRLSRVEDHLTSIDNAIGKLNTAVTKLIDLQRQQHVDDTTSSKPTQKRPSYYVQAIIPGRAWLRDDSGVTLTISPGDTLPGYGKVTRIDAEQGIVYTTSGEKIRYGIEEY